MIWSFHQNGKALSRFTIVCLSAIALGKLVISQQIQECSESKLRECTEVLSQKHDLDGPGPVYTREQVHKTCSPVLDAEDCVMRMYQNCAELQSISRPSLSAESLRQVEKCRVLMEKYVHKLECYLGLNSTYQKCLAKERDAFQKSLENIMGGNKELQQEGCCNVRRIFDCILIPTGEQCDRESMSFMEDFLHVSFPVGVTSVCPQYKCLDDHQQESGAKVGPEHEQDRREENKDKNAAPRNHSSYVYLCSTIVLLLAKNSFVSKTPM